MTSNHSTRADSPAHASLGLSLVLLLSLGAMWGGITALAKFVTMAGVPALGYAFWQTFGAGIILVLISFARGKPPPLGRTHLRHYLIIGAIGSAIPTTNLFYALSNLSTGVVALVITTVPLFTYLLSLAARVEGYDWRRAAGIGLGLAGALLILLPKGSLPSPDLIPFVILAFLSPFFYSLNSVYAIKFHPPQMDSMHAAAGMMFASSLMLLPASLATGTFHPLWNDFALADGLILVHMVLAALTFHMYFVLLRRTGPVYFSQVAFIVTINAVMWGVILFDEQHSLWIWLALALVFGGVALVNWRHKKQAAVS
jgi:drug/metabolite transporter (DMT)-like permease